MGAGAKIVCASGCDTSVQYAAYSPDLFSKALMWYHSILITLARMASTSFSSQVSVCFPEAEGLLSEGYC